MGIRNKRRSLFANFTARDVAPAEYVAMGIAFNGDIATKTSPRYGVVWDFQIHTYKMKLLLPSHL